MRVGITGAGGFTGRHLVQHLAAHGDQPIPLTSDVTDAAAMKREIAAVHPDAVIHLAAKAFVHSDDLESFYRVNQLGSINLLEAVASTKPGIPVLMASSAQVYGVHAEGLLSEEAHLTPSNHYAVSKFAMEMIANLFRDKIKIIIARPFNYTGIGQEDRYLVPKIVSHFARRAPKIELGNVDIRRDFGDVRAVVSAYSGLLIKSEPGIYNVSSGILYSVRDLLKFLSDISGHTMAVEVNPAFVRANDVPALGGLNGRLRSALPDWRPIPMEQTLTWMLNSAVESLQRGN